MIINDGLKKKMIRLLDHSPMSYAEIARACSIDRKAVERFVKANPDRPTSPSYEELACDKPSNGFLKYLEDHGGI